MLLSILSSVQCRRFLQARESFCSRKHHVETPTDRSKLGMSKGAGQRGRVVVNKQLSPAQNTPAMQAMSIATSAPVAPIATSGVLFSKGLGANVKIKAC